MLYYISGKNKHDDRVSALKKIECNYDFTNVNFPASYEDIETFENNNNESVFVYALTDDNDVVLSKKGNHDNLMKNKGNRINLLLISNQKKLIMFTLNIYLDYYTILHVMQLVKFQIKTIAHIVTSISIKMNI